MLKQISQEIYSNQLTSNKAMTVSDIATSRYDNVHKQMYTLALAKYKEEVNIDEDEYRFLEIPGTYYDSPSLVQVIYKKPPYNKSIVDLTPFWTPSVYTNRFSYKSTNEINYNNCEIIYKDFAKGTVKLRDKIYGYEYVVKLSDMPEYMSESDDMVNHYEDTFSYKYNNKIFGI